MCAAPLSMYSTIATCLEHLAVVEAFSSLTLWTGQIIDLLWYECELFIPCFNLFKASHMLLFYVIFSNKKIILW